MSYTWAYKFGKCSALSRYFINFRRQTPGVSNPLLLNWNILQGVRPCKGMSLYWDTRDNNLGIYIMCIYRLGICDNRPEWSINDDHFHLHEKI